MTALEALLARVGWSRVHLADLLGVSEGTIRGRDRIGTVWPEVLAWLEQVAWAYEQFPPPKVRTPRTPPR